jgi:Asp-tRNA(Asn)/Glu-tRNA(Gln) amidotransferase A subunit family amidase
MAAIGQAAADLTQMSALELAEAIRSKRVSSEDVIEAHLRRIEAVNPSINAVTVVLGEGALRGARQADEAVARGGDLPPLLGVPFTIKRTSIWSAPRRRRAPRRR